MESVSPVRRIDLTLTALSQIRRQIVVSAVDHPVPARAGKGSTSPDLHRDIILQIIHAAPHT